MGTERFIAMEEFINAGVPYGVYVPAEDHLPPGTYKEVGKKGDKRRVGKEFTRVPDGRPCCSL